LLFSKYHIQKAGKEVSSNENDLSKQYKLERKTRSELLLDAGGEVRWSCVEKWSHVEQTVDCWHKVIFLHQGHKMLDTFCTELGISAHTYTHTYTSECH